MNSTDNMDSRNKLQVVIGIYNQPSNLMVTLETLTARGFIVADLCVSGTINTLSMTGSMFKNRVNIHPELLDLFIRTDSYQTIEGSQNIVSSKGSLFVALYGLLDQRRKIDSDSSIDNCNMISSELVAHMEQGQLVLVVDVKEPRQLIRASRVLLRSSPYSIQTHEFILP